METASLAVLQSYELAVTLSTKIANVPFAEVSGKHFDS